MKVLLTHTPQARHQYYGERSLTGLQALAQVTLHEADDALDTAGLIEAARAVDIIVADRLTAASKVGRRRRAAANPRGMQGYAAGR